MSEVPLYVRGHMAAALAMKVIKLPEASCSLHIHRGYRGTSLIKNSAPLGPYSRTESLLLWWP